RLRLAMRLPVCAQNAASSGLQSWITEPTLRGLLASWALMGRTCARDSRRCRSSPYFGAPAKFVGASVRQYPPRHIDRSQIPSAPHCELIPVKPTPQRRPAPLRSALGHAPAAHAVAHVHFQIDLDGVF